jgi:hypothetical protein
VRKHRLQIDRNAHSYDLHSYGVRAANEDCALARSLNKLLEHRFAGAIRLMGRAKTDEEVRLVWDRLRDGGQIAGGYWAVMSHTHVPASFKTRVFGEVHMLSHYMGMAPASLPTGSSRPSIGTPIWSRACADPRRPSSRPSPHVMQPARAHRLNH